MAAARSKIVSSVFRPSLFKNKVAVVTGGATGIGKAITEELLYLGCDVMIASRKADRLKQAAAEIKQILPDSNVAWMECNIRKEDQVNLLMDTTIKEFGKIDILVNNGGGQFYTPTENFNLKGWNAVVETNLTGTFLCCKAVYHKWMAEHGGIIVNIIADMFKGMPGMSHSGAARAGVENLTKTLAIEWADRGIRINCIAPGSSIYSDTARANYGPENFNIFNQNIPYIPMKRLGKPEEISTAVCFLCSPSAAFITGITLPIDGGGRLYNGSWPIGDNKIPAYSWEADIQDGEGNSTVKSKL